MRLSPRLTSLPPLAALVLAVAVPAAHAAHHDLNFISSPGAFSASGFDSGGTHYDEYMLVLAVEPTVTLMQGDTVTATLNLDAPFTVPTSPSVYLTSFLIVLNDQHGAFPAGDTASSGSVTLSLNGASQTLLSQNVSTSSQVAFGAVYSQPADPPLSIDQAVFDFTITTMAEPGGGDSNHALIYFTNVSPAVPEPATTALWLAGLGAVALRHRRGAGA